MGRVLNKNGRVENMLSNYKNHFSATSSHTVGNFSKVLHYKTKKYMLGPTMNNALTGITVGVWKNCYFHAGGGQ